MFNVEEVLNRLKNKFNLKSDKELAELLEITNKTLSGWKIRNSLDFRKILNLAKKENLSLDFIFFGLENANTKNIDNFDEFFEDYVFYNLKRNFFKKGILNRINPNLIFLFKIVRKNINSMSFTLQNAKEILIDLIVNYKINSVLESEQKKENVLELVKDLSKVECYVFLKYFDKFDIM